MIHPDPCNIIPVRYELSLPAPDDGRIAAVDSDPAIIINQHLPDAVRIHNQQCQTVLP